MAKDSGSNLVEVFCAYITRNGKRIYPKKAKCFHFWAKAKNSKS
jgi:hypothetical protein